MNGNSKCEVHDIEIETLKRDLQEIKEENKLQNKEFREVFKHIGVISEAVVEIKTYNKSINNVLESLDKKIDDTDKKIDTNNQDTNKKIEDLKNEIYKDKIESRWDWQGFIKNTVIPLLIMSGVTGGIIILVLKTLGKI